MLEKEFQSTACLICLTTKNDHHRLGRFENLEERMLAYEVAADFEASIVLVEAMCCHRQDDIFHGVTIS